MDARELADALPDGVVVADAAGAVVLVSALAGRMLGVDPAASLGRPLGDVLTLSNTDGQTWAEANQPYDTLRTVTGTPEQAWLLPDGTEVLVVSTIRRPSLAAPVDQVVISLRSGRGRKRLDRERSDLVATVAHELRSPLTGVKGFVQALLNRWDKLNDDQKKLMLRTVASDSDRLSRLIAELLDVARIDTGRLQLYPRASDASVLVTRVVESVRSATSRPIELHIAGGPDGAAEDELEIHADPDKFTQVVTNLVENAVRHGDGVVTVSLGAWPDDPAQVLLVVEDQGEGIPAELHQRVFTKFWKHGARGGSGLGLYIVGGLTKAHGGSVRIGDADGGGACIEVAWPREQPAT
ncbi:HAMP domain-containing sensor histidine kinase [Nocardioides sp.]|uniref:sensor histidine kinase n=1 Tax=Nocardioides sp. TaxID=35761 RepID=UPI0019BB6F3E|nr:HAMP domain-containing sensor histidine kinase [Nocardioides sp.]MBC7275528.1 HAMP domain-containing histidine kinase [Nocardioides sp.]